MEKYEKARLWLANGTTREKLKSISIDNRESSPEYYRDGYYYDEYGDLE